jgi:transcriptional regulator with XRE-family HTH domain
MSSNAPADTPFLRYLQEEWMWRQRPPLRTPTEFAKFLGIKPQTVFGWFRGQRPQADALIEISNKTGLPLRKLLELNGYPIPKELEQNLKSLDEENRDTQSA